MQQFNANTNRKPVNILLSLYCAESTKIKIRAIDPLKYGAVYIDRVATFKGEKDFEIRLPQSPNKLLIKVSAVGKKGGGSGEVEVVGLEKTDLPQHLPCLTGKKVASFLTFAREFCENAGILSAGRYQSDDRKYTIDYLPQIVHENGQTLTTPARISNSTGRMEISQKSFKEMSIPMRMAIILHEFSHFYLNEVQSDEIEADLNALTLYMGMGYPVIEAHKAFLETFHKHPSEGNKERYVYLKTFIDNFDSLKHEICATT
jgi:hypothetical protein